MRYVHKIEAIGDNYAAQLRRYNKSKAPFTKREMQAFQLGGIHLSPWVARITGIDDRHGFKREFIKGQKDYSGANGSGSRGIWLFYFLEPGLYEINQRVKWKRVERFFAWVVNESTMCRLTREEAIQWLRVKGD